MLTTSPTRGCTETPKRRESRSALCGRLSRPTASGFLFQLTPAVVKRSAPTRPTLCSTLHPRQLATRLYK